MNRPGDRGLCGACRGRVTRCDRARDGLQVVAIGERDGSIDLTIEAQVLYRQTMSPERPEGEEVVHVTSGPPPGAGSMEVEAAQ